MIAVVGALVVVVLALFPAWKEYAEEHERLGYFQGESLGRAWILQNPESRSTLPESSNCVRIYVGIDWWEQARWVWIVLMLTFGAVLLLGRRRTWYRPTRRGRRPPYSC